LISSTISFKEDELYKEFNTVEEFMYHLRLNGVGALITTLGNDLYNFNIKKFFEIIGLESMKSYNNYRHGSNTKQTLFIKTI
jgi:hypothetical protein